jgi:hypothetical protein
MLWSRVLRRCVVIAAVVAPAAGASAEDGFEIQVYDVETAPRGEVGLELHVNQHVIAGAAGETHVTLEPHYGLADWAELGGYLQSSVTTGGDLAYAGVKLRLKLRRPERIWGGRIGLAINGELSAVPARFEPQVWGSELRPVIDLTIGPVYAALNPILTVDLRGEAAGHPQLEPAAKLAAKLGGELAIGVEAYAGFGPLDDLGRERTTRVLGVIDVGGGWWDLNLGGGYGWGSPDHVVAKLIFGVHPRG